MKTARKTKMLALLLTVLMAVLSLPVLTLPISASAAAVPEFKEGEVIYATDFTDGNPLDGWTMTGVGPTFQWNPEYGSAKIENGKLRVASSGGTKVVALPALNGEFNYAYSATFTVNNAGGSFGLLADMENPATSTNVAMHAIVYTGNSGAQSIYHYNRSGSNHGQPIYTNITDVLGKAVAQGETHTLTLYNLNGNSYFFIDGKYASTNIVGNNASTHDVVGIYTCGADVSVSSVSVKKVTAKGLTDAMTLPGATIRYANADGTTTGEKSHALRFAASVDKTSDFYKGLISGGTYDVANESVKFGMLLLPADLLPADGVMKVDTPDVVATDFTKIAGQNDTSLDFTVALFGIPEDEQARPFVARLYVKEKVGDTWEYTYSKSMITRSYAGVANIFYEDTTDQEIRARLDAIFANCGIYFGSNTKRMKFTLLADFHYKQGMYMSSIADMQAILDRAHDSASDFIIHAGDFCNDYLGSWELHDAYLNNNYSLPAYGVYGNHELESGGNSMQVVTPLLNNSEVVWGTEDGKIGDGSIAYFYFEVNGFRIVCTDTNYSWNNTKQIWEHNYTCSYGWPSGNSKGNSLGPVQLEWLEEVLTDAAEKKIPCIVMSHESFSGIWSAGGDAAEVREIMNAANAKQPGTVLMAINGHLHTNHAQIKDGILYFDMNTVRNGSWRGSQESHYTTETFEYVEYDNDGKEVSRSQKTLDSLSMGKQTWFFADPLSAVVTVSSSGRIVIEGMESEWINGVVANNLGDGEEPEVLSGTFDVPLY